MRSSKRFFSGFTRSAAVVVLGVFTGVHAVPVACAQAEPGKAHPGAPEPTIRTVDDLLRLVEQADIGLETLGADIQYDRKMKLVGDRHVRLGKLFFIADQAGGEMGKKRRAFAVSFENLWINNRYEDDPQDWIFDGQWLVERRVTQHQFIKRRIAAPGDDFDPLRIGEGPMPIPIGQRADDIRKRYETELRPASDIFEVGSNAAKFVSGSHQLRLVPKPEFAEEEDFTEVRLWYRWDSKQGRILPRMARTTSRSGDESYVKLINVKVNMPIADATFSVDPPAEGAGWDVEIIDEFANQDRADAVETHETGDDQ